MHRVRDTDEVPGFPWAERHTWIELADGTIIDPTMTQFWGEGHSRTRGSLSTSKTGVFAPDHPVAHYYQQR